RVDQLVGLQLAAELTKGIRPKPLYVAIGDLKQDAKRRCVERIAERVGRDPSFDLDNPPDKAQISSVGDAVSVSVFGIGGQMRGEIESAIVFRSLPPLLKQGQTGTRVVRPKWAIHWGRVGNAMVVSHALALVAIATKGDQVGPP